MFALVYHLVNTARYVMPERWMPKVLLISFVKEEF